MFESSQSSIQSTCDFNRDFQSQQNVHRLDVCNHHRVCDAQKHLLHTLAKLEKRFIDSYKMNLTIQHNV